MVNAKFLIILFFRKKEAKFCGFATDEASYKRSLHKINLD